MAGRPVLFGYQRMHLAASNSDVRAGQQALEEFAGRVGFRLLRVFIEADANRPCRELVRLIVAVRESGAQAVAVPKRTDLGGTPFVQSTIRSMIERDARAEVLVVDDLAATPDARLRAGGWR